MGIKLSKEGAEEHEIPFFEALINIMIGGIPKPSALPQCLDELIDWCSEANGTMSILQALHHRDCLMNFEAVVKNDNTSIHPDDTNHREDDLQLKHTNSLPFCVRSEVGIDLGFSDDMV